MKPKHLIPLAVILLILVGLVYYRQQQQQPLSLEEQYELTQLLPEDLDASEIGRIVMYAGAKPDEKVTLERKDGGWVVSSHYSAPVQEEKLREFLDTLTGLEGEFRATASEGDLDEYELTNETGFHVVGYAEGASDPIFHVINGKSPDFGLAFARPAASDDVYVLDVSLRREAGIYTAEIDDAPKPGTWLDKRVLDVDSGDITRLALTYPDKQLAFELQQQEAAEDESSDGEAEETGDGEEAAPAEQTVEWDWVVTQGGVNYEFHSNAVTNVTRRLAGLNASDIVDPATPEQWGLDAPQYELAFTVKGGDAPTVLQVGKPKDDRYAYFRVANADRDLVYKVSGYDFEQIFLNGGEFFELPGVLADAAEVDTIEYTIGGDAVKLARDGANWRVAEPDTSIDVDPRTVDTIVRTVLSWKAEDYADSAEGKGLDDPSDALTFRGPNLEHTIALGAVGPAEGRYARLDGREQVLVMSEADVADIFVPHAALFETALFDIAPDAVTQLTITKDEKTARLTRNTNDTWSLTIGDETSEANPAAVDALLAALTGLKAEDFAFGDARIQGGVLGSVTFTTEDEAEHHITIEIAQNGLHPVTKRGSVDAYLVPAEAINNALVDFESLMPAPEPEASADGNAEEPANADTEQESAEEQ